MMNPAVDLEAVVLKLTKDRDGIISLHEARKLCAQAMEATEALTRIQTTSLTEDLPWGQRRHAEFSYKLALSDLRRA